MNMPQQGVYAITRCEGMTTQTLLKKTQQILRHGAVMLQYRNKSDSKCLSQAQALQKLCAEFTIPFIVNDDVKLAKAIAADGVHLGQYDMDYTEARTILGPNMIIGVSCYRSLERAMVAQRRGADYVAFGACFPSATKPNASLVELELLSEATQNLDIPIVAVGGITPNNASLLINTGIRLLAVIEGIYGESASADATCQYVKLLRPIEQSLPVEYQRRLK